MKVMVIVKATPNTEKGVMPSAEFIAEMTAFNEALVKAGVMVDGDGLRPSSFGKRVRLSGEKREVIDGPFPNTRELVAGYWIWEVKSIDEAVEWARRCPNPMPGEESELEIRPLVQPEDFGEALTPEILEREARMRETVERQRA